MLLSATFVICIVAMFPGMVLAVCMQPEGNSKRSSWKHLLSVSALYGLSYGPGRYISVLQEVTTSQRVAGIAFGIFFFAVIVHTLFAVKPVSLKLVAVAVGMAVGLAVAMLFLHVFGGAPLGSVVLW